MKRKNIIIFLAFSVILLILGVVGYNINKCQFFDIKLSLLLTLALGAVISYLLTQLANSDSRKRKFIEELICEVKMKINCESLYEFTGREKHSEILLRNREITNDIDALISISEKNKKYINPEDLKYIEEKFSAYQNDIVSNIDDTQKLIEMGINFKKEITLINSKLNTIRTNLYLY